jgi:hypothetical protein
VIALLGLGATGGGVALGMIPQPFAAAPAPTTTPSPTEPAAPSTPAAAPVQETPDPLPTQTTTPSPSATPVAGTLPTDCRALVPASEYDRLFGSTPLQDPAGSEAGTDGEGLTPSFSCIWQDPRADVSGLIVYLGTATPEAITANATTLSKDGYSCSDRDGGRLCQMTTPDATYPVDTTLTFYGRGSTWLVIRQTNFPTTDLLGAVEQQIWG